MGEENPTIVFKRPGVVTIENRPIPELREGSVLIRTRKTLISTGTELTILKGDFPGDSAWARYGRYPFVPGYDNVGIVVDVGPGVDKNLVGRRVATTREHAMHVCAGQDELRFVPEGVTDEQAAFFTIAEIVMNSVRRADVRLGESVMIYGAGLLGQFAARFCRLCGARPVMVVDISKNRLDMLPSDPAILKLNSGEVDVAEEVSRATRGRMADVVFEVTGDPNLIVSEFRCLRRQGRFVVLSSPRGPTLFDFHDLCNSPSFTIIGTHNSSHPPFETPDNPWTMRRNCELFFDLVSSGEVKVDGLISHRKTYKDAPDVYKMLLEDRTRAMGVILDWT
jgi:2-desacetyl-2-hydroxyethyl bacteriochlorophyllide A dehydrogenase